MIAVAASIVQPLIDGIRSRRSSMKSKLGIMSELWLLVGAVPFGGPGPASAAEPASRYINLHEGNEIRLLFDSLEGAIPGRMAEAKVPGLSMAIVDRDGVVWARGFGVRSAGGSAPVTTETLFSVQSISKVVTATAIMIAVQEGLVDLDAPVSAYLPGFTVHSRYEERPEKVMTIRHLLKHTSGLGHEAPVGNNFSRGATTLEDHVRSIADTWTLFPVGSRYKYSNLGMDLAGYILQAASKTPFEAYVERKLLAPLGIRASTFDASRIGSYENRACGSPPGDAALVYEQGMIPCGGFYATASELGESVRLHLNGGTAGSKRVLEERYVDAMMNEPFAVAGQLYGHGLGVFKMNRLAGKTLRRPFAMHSGGGFGFGANVTWLPEFGVGAVVLTNSPNAEFAAGLAHRALAAILEAYGASLDTYRPYADLVEVDIDDEKLKPLLGTYTQTRDRIEFCIQDGTPGFKLIDGRFFAAHFVAEREAYIDIPGAAYSTLIRFVPNLDGAGAYLCTVHDGDAYAYCDGPNDPPGPDDPRWERYVGSYEWLAGDAPVLTTNIHRRNGWLYLEDMKLVEHEPGLFFLPHGEYVDARGPVPIGGGVAGRRKN
jgi:CubicO group peptidase (beta-lactamase class C family)